MDLARRFSQPAPSDRIRALDLSALLGPEPWSRLPDAVQRRFAAGHAAASYSGTLDLRCSALGHGIALFTALFGGPLTTLRMADVPAEVRVHADGRGGVVWERRLRVPGAEHDRIVRSTKEPGPGGRLVERTDGGLAMELEVLEEDGALVFRSLRYLLVLGAWRLPVPTWLSPGTCRVEHRDLGAGRFRFSLSMVHPRWGQTFHQSGVFADPPKEPA